MAAMATYVRAGLPEVATALAALTGEPHPLAITSFGAEDADSKEAGKAAGRSQSQRPRPVGLWELTGSNRRRH
jgi:hypothetical protein